MNQNQSNLFLEDIILKHGRVNGYLQNQFLGQVKQFEIVLKLDKHGYKVDVFFQFNRDGETLTQTDWDYELSKVFASAEQSFAYGQAVTMYLSHVVPVTTSIAYSQATESQA